MSSRGFFTWFALAAICVAVPAAAAAQTQAGEEVVVPLTDPSRPAMVTVSSFGGHIVVRGTNRRDVLVRRSGGRGLTGRGRPPEPPPPGLRRLTPDGGFAIEERDNEVSVDGGGPLAGSVSFDIEVPLKTNLKLSTMQGNLTVTSVDGALELNSMNGDLSLANVAGSVVAHTVNGDVTAVLTRADAGAPMAFTTLNGDVDVTLPAAIRATLKLRTDMGDMFTDFDIPATTSRSATRSTTQNGRFRFEVERAVMGNLNGGGPEIELRSFNGRVSLRRGK